MSIEKIRQLQRQQAEEAVRKAREKQESEDRYRIEAEERRRQEIRAAEERQRFERSTRERVLRESGALHNLQRIERELLEGNVRKHTLLVNPESGSCAMLAWGNKFSIKEGGIDYEKPFFGFGTGVIDYSCISVGVNPDTEEISISGGIIKKEEWISNKAIVEDRIAQAYLNPQHISDHERPSSSYDSSSSSNSECCNS